MVRMDASYHVVSSSSEEERDEKIGNGTRRLLYQTPTKRPITRAATTPATVTDLTPSPRRMPFSIGVSSNSGTNLIQASESTPPSHESFLTMQHDFLENGDLATTLFQEISPCRTRRKRRSFPEKRSRLSNSLLLADYTSPRLSRGMEGRRSFSSSKVKSLGNTPSPESSRNARSMHLSPKGSPERCVQMNPRNISWANLENLSQQLTKPRGKVILFLWGFLALSLGSSLEMIILTRSAVQHEQIEEPSRLDAPISASGLRGQMTSGHWEEKDHASKRRVQSVIDTTKLKAQHKGKDSSSHPKHASNEEDTLSKASAKQASTRDAAGKHAPPSSKKKHLPLGVSSLSAIPKIHIPPPISMPKPPLFEFQDINMYTSHSSENTRVVALDPSYRGALDTPPRSVKLYPADFSDNTQLYSILESSDERLAHMEIRKPHSDGECVPMQEWQTTFHPSCNGVHEIAIESLGEESGNDVSLFGTKGFWRYAWRLDVQNLHEQDTIVLKTLKYNHNFEDAHFEHDRVDAVAMERLTRSPHVINVFGFCGHSVLTEFADGPRVGELADKSKRKALARLKIASDIAHGLADVHGIDGDGNATFVHLDVNLANVVSINGTLKLNDFNIGIIRRWNTTSNTPCGFPAQYPNPQWRSPEEARNEQSLTEKVDVFSMGHIFFRLICGHEPWNKLEPAGRPSKEEIITRVQRGDLPFIPDFVRDSEDLEMVAIRDAMLSCYTFDPTKRPSARDVANTLDKALESLAHLANQERAEESA